MSIYREKSVFLLALLLSGIVHADIYQWVDKNGKVHFSDKPQAENAKRLEIQQAIDKGSTRPDKNKRNAKRQRLLDDFELQRNEKKQRQREAQGKKAKLNKACNKERDYLANLIKAGHIYSLDRDGKRVYLSDRSREETIAKTRQRISRFCR